MHRAGHFSMLGLGDVVMPGLLLCFVLRYDAFKKMQLIPGGCESGVPPPRHLNRISYFHCSLIGYFLGLLTATVSSEVFKAAQPALLYLVPFTLLPLLTMAYLKVNIELHNHPNLEAMHRNSFSRFIGLTNFRKLFLKFLFKKMLIFIQDFRCKVRFLIGHGQENLESHQMSGKFAKTSLDIFIFLLKG